MKYVNKYGETILVDFNLSELELQLEFNDIHYCKTNKMNVVSFYMDNELYYYFIDLDCSVEQIYYSDHCRYQGEINEAQVDDYTFNVSLTKIAPLMFYDYDPDLVNLDNEEIILVQNWLNNYFNENPETAIKFI